MNPQPRLIDVPADSPTLRRRLTAFKETHGILTHRASHLIRRDEPWLALTPFDCDVGKSVSQIMGESAQAYERAGWCATSTGELSAIRKLCGQLEIECDL